ncbi:hypothetical protein N7449_000868 [Penicillium cf. viridicatum]|uniref:Uncharacterized protein n=1 Tax=Penicillium cf. viridicatum TaxID=2972119 RepID=A0A9W9N6R5_9EURO|nr:hypothetical protein N7449_000868 [Penicillium cf. viridicatum]
MGGTIMTDQYAHLLECENFDLWEDVENDTAMKTKAVAPIPLTAPKLENEYACLVVRQQFDWWEDVENDIVMKTKSIPSASSVPITTPKLDDKYARLLARERFNWWEEVENDITKKTKTLAVDTNNPTTDTENLTTACTGLASASAVSNLDDEYSQPSAREHCDPIDDVENDTAMKTKSLPMDTEIHITDTGHMDTTSTDPTTTNKLDDQDARSPVYYDCSKGVENDITVNTKDLAVISTSLTTASNLNDNFAQLLLSEHENWPGDAKNDIAMDTENLAVQNELLATTNAFISEYDNWSEDAESDISMGTEDLAANSEPHATANGPVTAVELDDTYAQISHPDTSDVANDVETTLAMDHRLEINTVTTFSNEFIDGGNEAVLQMRGSALVEACNDHTYNHYSLHGNWINDDFAMRRMIVPDVVGIPVVGSISDGEFAIGNGIFENGPLISRNEWMDWQDQLVAATKEPNRSPRKMTWKPSPSNLKIKSMASEQLPLNQILTYSCVPLEILSDVIQKAGVTPKKMVPISISSPIGIMETVTRKAWSGRKSIPDTPFTIRPGIIGDLIKKACDSLRKCFAFPLGIISAIMKKAWPMIKAVFNSHKFVFEILSMLSN